MNFGVLGMKGTDIDTLEIVDQIAHTPRKHIA